jgi:hypothetical protein
MQEPDSNKQEAAGASCGQFDRELPAFLEGEDKPEVRAHAQQCPYCGVIFADLQQIFLASRQMPLDEPPARVWANICAVLAAEGILREQISGWRRWIPRFIFLPNSAPVGALACLALFGVILLVPPGYFEKRGTPGRFPAGETVTAAAYSGLDSNLAQTLREMENSYLAREGFLEPTIKATYRASLDALNATIRECLKHCQREPGNTLAREYLVNAYQLKAEVLASALEFGGR